MDQKKTYNSRYSLVVTHPTTNLPIWCLCMAERTGCPFLTSLWSYVTVNGLSEYLQDTQNGSTEVQNQNGGLDYKQEKYK